MTQSSDRRTDRTDRTATLGIHRSTLLYRLHLIRSLTQYDLTDPETQFNLQLATRIQLA
ncbi:helix-turn-helix domain-containing protein [Pseudonocardia sp.]|uniref:helix-turn-helix domain-containing protein n=1 Tax=Pseudonocardia sp. TaxID=60912 RepID=UPI0039C932E9